MRSGIQIIEMGQCLNCIYFWCSFKKKELETLNHKTIYGICNRYPQPLGKTVNHWCGEFKKD